jgi:hypothetical protein
MDYLNDKILLEWLNTSYLAYKLDFKKINFWHIYNNLREILDNELKWFKYHTYVVTWFLIYFSIVIYYSEIHIIYGLE